MSFSHNRYFVHSPIRLCTHHSVQLTSQSSFKRTKKKVAPNCNKIHNTKIIKTYQLRPFAYEPIKSLEDLASEGPLTSKSLQKLAVSEILSSDFSKFLAYNASLQLISRFPQFHFAFSQLLSLLPHFARWTQTWDPPKSGGGTSCLSTTGPWALERNLQRWKKKQLLSTSCVVLYIFAKWSANNGELVPYENDSRPALRTTKTL